MMRLRIFIFSKKERKMLLGNREHSNIVPHNICEFKTTQYNHMIVPIPPEDEMKERKETF